MALTESSTNNHQISSTFLYQLVFDIKHCIFKAGNETKLLFSIYDDTEKRIVTEEYCLDIQRNNFPKIRSPDECKVLFKNLPYNILQHNIFIICRIYRIGSMEQPDIMNHRRQKKRKDKATLLRPYGGSVIRLHNFIDDIFSFRIVCGYVIMAQTTLNLNILYKHIPELIIFVIMSYYNGKSFKDTILSTFGKETKFDPKDAPIYCPKEERTFNDLPFDVIHQKKGTYWDNVQNTTVQQLNYYVAPLSIGIAYGLTLYHGNVSVVKKNYKFYDQLTEIETLCMYSLLNIERHILYVTISDVHVNQRNKCAACNVCVNMELRHNDTYNRVPNAISFGKQKFDLFENESESIIYYHTNDPVINQTYRVSVPLDIAILKNCHLYFSCWHVGWRKRSDPRGFTYIKLYNDTLKQFIDNQRYELKLYRETNGRYLHETECKFEHKSISIHYRLESTKII